MRAWYPTPVRKLRIHRVDLRKAKDADLKVMLERHGFDMGGKNELTRHDFLTSILFVQREKDIA